MASQLEHRIDALAASRDRRLLAQLDSRHRKGEPARAADGNLSQAPHPAALGSALTHPLITTDFCESQPELITGVHTTVEGCLDELSDIHRFVYRVARRRAALVFEHAVHARTGRSRCPIAHLRPIEHRPHQEHLSAWAQRALRPSDADDLRHPLQLLDSDALWQRHRADPGQAGQPRVSRRRVLRSDPQLPSAFVAADLSVRRIAVVVQVVRQRQTAQPRQFRRRVRCSCRRRTSLRMGGLGYTATHSRICTSRTTRWRSTHARCSTR